MKRFIAKKTIKIKRYQLWSRLLVISLLLILTLQIVFSISINLLNNHLPSSFIAYTYGNLLPTTSTNKYFYKSIFGFTPKEKEIKEVFSEDNISKRTEESNPTVYIYNTFQTDKYKQNYYSSYNINPVVTQASKILAEHLKKYNIYSYVEERSVAKILKENSIPYNLSYRGSRILLEEAIKENVTLKYFIDLGLSSDAYAITTLKKENENYAKILFIVGTENENYLKNQELANRLHTKINIKMKDLSRGVSLRGGVGYHGVYNEDISPNALLIYIGGKENTIREVNNSLEILSSAYQECIKEDYEKGEK